MNECFEKKLTRKRAMMSRVHADLNMKTDCMSEPHSLPTVTNTTEPKKDSVHTPDQVLYLRTGFCKHNNTTEFKIPSTDIIIIQCVTCNKEIDRYYALM
jgi:hypothetical protein